VIDPIATVSEVDPATWAECIRINLLGSFHVLRACLPLLPAGGVVVNLSSGAAGAEHCGWSAYAAAKAGVERLSATLAAERPDLHVYALRPGVTATPMQEAIRASRVDNAIRRLPAEALQPPEVPARAIARLFGPGALRPAERVLEAKSLLDGAA
jgi:NAD(P)-dependent dehydrogenase (short-subunit alcohol dehydrogenase family)